MSIQYPHKLFFISSGTPVQDGNGNWTNPASGSWQAGTSRSTDCRDEPTDKGTSTTVVDGEVVTFSSIVYGILQLPDLKRGDRVRITHKGNARLEGSVKRFSRDHFHVRIWV